MTGRPPLSIALPDCGCPKDNEYDYYAQGHRPANARPCGCTSYCALRAHAANWEAMSEDLNHPWPAPTHSTVARETSLQFSGVMLTLYPDGHYDLSDTTGG